MEVAKGKGNDQGVSARRNHSRNVAVVMATVVALRATSGRLKDIVGLLAVAPID